MKLKNELTHPQESYTAVVDDLSRGCSIEDVYRMIAITANQAIAAKNNK